MSHQVKSERMRLLLIAADRFILVKYWKRECGQKLVLL